MTESIIDPRASQSFLIVTAEQMAALRSLLFLLIRCSHLHETGELRGIEQRDAEEMHTLLRKFEGTP